MFSVVFIVLLLLLISSEVSKAQGDATSSITTYHRTASLTVATMPDSYTLKAWHRHMHRHNTTKELLSKKKNY